MSDLAHSARAAASPNPAALDSGPRVMQAVRRRGERRRMGRRPRRRAVLARARPARGRRSASGKRLELCRARALLPPYDTAATLARLARLIARYAPRCVMALGDSFHDGGGPARLATTDRESARRAAARPRLDLDHRQSRSRACRPISAACSTRRCALGALTFRHLPTGAATAKSPAICIRWRASRSAAAPSAAAALPRTPRAW